MPKLTFDYRNFETKKFWDSFQLVVSGFVLINVMISTVEVCRRPPQIPNLISGGYFFNLTICIKIARSVQLIQMLNIVHLLFLFFTWIW